MPNQKMIMSGQTQMTQKGNVGKGLVWHRLNSAITDSEDIYRSISTYR